MFNSSDSNWLCDPVCVNVGGEVYTTTVDTLTRCQDSMLGAMFTGKIPLLRDKHGNVFIDRDGKVFRYILNYLRGNSLDLPWDYSELDLLRREADFFQIRPLLVELKRRECEWRRSCGALLSVDMDSVERVMHFNYKQSPENYELRSCTVRMHTANVFCTSQKVIELLCTSFSYKRGDFITASQAEQMELHLEWVPCPPELPCEQHTRFGFQELIANQQDDARINNTRGFMTQLLRVVLPEGFRVDLVTPDPADILNCCRLRCVRY
ncbi:BTB/POZ domain-containing protein KCTD21-like [Brachyhypopomus gauderio]|uniref:BTB/POZ domain-containing protein KCTD21-like n=1 Tax=Brachyhypopomus gauderio TaxID=698409 RepID=UPI004042331B